MENGDQTEGGMVMTQRRNTNTTTADQDETDNHWKQILAAFSGNFLEWYDFSVYGYLSDVIGKVFFPQSDKTTRLALSFTVFGSAFFARPIGALLLARLGDKYGTKVPIAVSIILMGTSSFGLGCLPSYDRAGIVAPIMLIILRLMQGLSVGGQLIPTILFSVENIEKEKRGFQFALVFMSGNCGFLCGNLISALLRRTLSDEQLHDWGWRIPFWLGILVCVSGIYLRYYVEETEENHDYNSKERFREIFYKENLKPTFCFIAVVASFAVTYYVAFTWLVVWMDHLLKPPVANAYLINAAAFSISTILFSPVAGYLVDRIQNNEAIIYISNPLLGFCFPLALYLIKTSRNGGVAFILLFVLGILNTTMPPAIFNYFVLKFSPRIRVTAMSFAWNIALAVFGGMAPAVSTGLFHMNKIAPGFSVTAAAVIAVIGIYLAGKSLNDYDDDEEANSPSIPVKNIDEMSDTDNDPLLSPLISQETFSTHHEIT